MKTDRLLSIVIYLLNREITPARELAEKFEVSVRTIQRDMEAIELAGIPVVTTQGPNGGYGIMETYRIDRQFVTLDELYFIITALGGIGSSLADRKIASSLEKMKSLMPETLPVALSQKMRKYSLDFSMLGGGPNVKSTLRTIEQALESDRLLRFTYTNNKLESAERIVEPMTLAFRWQSWYLYAYCRLKSGYRLFRVSRMEKVELLASRFVRRKKSYEEFIAESGPETWGRMIELTLRFDPMMRAFVEEFYAAGSVEHDGEGRFVVRSSMPEDGRMYGFLLSFGPFVEVLSPDSVRRELAAAAKSIAKLYESPEIHKK